MGDQPEAPSWPPTAHPLMGRCLPWLPARLR